MSKLTASSVDVYPTPPSGTWSGPPASAAACIKRHEGEVRTTSELDRIDMKILAVLQEDGALSAAEVAEAVGLSQSPCWRRIQRLKAEGYISKIVAVLNRQKLELRAHLFVHVKVVNNDKHNLQEFSQAIRAFPEVMECHVVLGAYDFLLRVIAADMDAYQKFFFEKLSQLQGLKYFLAGPAFEEEIVAAERRLNVSFPPQVKRFYQSYNGLRVDDPQLEVLPMERLDFVSPNRLHFATLDGNRRLFFDVSHLNQANQWFIVAEDDYLVTFTMASFWTRKMWAWIMEKRAIWEDECHHEEHPDHP